MTTKKLDDSTKTKYNKEGGPEEKKPKLYHKRSKRIFTPFNLCDLFKQKIHTQENVTRHQQLTNKRFRQNC